MITYYIIMSPFNNDNNHNHHHIYYHQPILSFLPASTQRWPPRLVATERRKMMSCVQLKGSDSEPGTEGTTCLAKVVENGWLPFLMTMEWGKVTLPRIELHANIQRLVG